MYSAKVDRENKQRDEAGARYIPGYRDANARIKIGSFNIQCAVSAI